MMLILGLFVFSVDTTPYQQLKRASSQRCASNSRIGARPHYQYLGPDEESIALSGTLYPELTGGQQDLAMLNAMALSGKPYALLSGNGEALGLWVIEQVENTGGIAYANEKMNQFKNEALEALHQFPESPVRQGLEDMVLYVTDRKY